MKEHRDSYLVGPSVVDCDFSQFSALPASDLHPTVEESKVGGQLTMLSYALAVGLCSADATGAKAADSADHACEAIQVGLCGPRISTISFLELWIIQGDRLDQRLGETCISLK